MSVAPQHRSRVSNPARQLPRVSGLPVVGALPAFLRQPFTFLREAQRKHGDIYLLDLGLIKWVVLNHPRHAEQIMVSNIQNYRKGGAMWDTVRELLGNGLVVSEGDFWLRQRRMMQPHFHRQQLIGLTEAMVAATAETLELWEAAATSQQPFEALRGFAPITMRVIVRALFGQGLDLATIERFHERMAYVLDFFMIGAATRSLPRWLPIPGAKRYRQTIQELDREVYEIIARERNAETPSDSLLAMLVHARDEETGEAMTDQQIHDEVMTFVLAGYETTSLALTWTMHFLTRHPHILEQVRAEVDSVLGGRIPEFNDLPRLSYTRAVLQESMRLRPPSWWLPRTAVEDDEIDGYAIPAGTTVVSLAYGIHHNPSVWENPDNFDPQRFLQPAANRHKLAWVPFGTGQRQCIGRDFAMMEGQIILAMLLQRYDLQAVPGSDFPMALSSTLKPKDGSSIQLRHRQ